jgi:RNA recognition motif-containing protein
MHNGRSKGCGIVEYADINGTNRAIKELNDLELMGRKIFVREDRKRGGGGGNGAKAGGGGREGEGGYLAGWNQRGGAAAAGGLRGNAGSLSMYVGNLAYETTWQELKDHMRAAGNVDNVRFASLIFFHSRCIFSRPVASL